MHHTPSPNVWYQQKRKTATHHNLNEGEYIWQQSRDSSMKFPSFSHCRMYWFETCAHLSGTLLGPVGFIVYLLISSLIINNCISRKKKNAHAANTTTHFATSCQFYWTNHSEVFEGMHGCTQNPRVMGFSSDSFHVALFTAANLWSCKIAHARSTPVVLYHPVKVQSPPFNHFVPLFYNATSKKNNCVSIVFTRQFKNHYFELKFIPRVLLNVFKAYKIFRNEKSAGVSRLAKSRITPSHDFLRLDRESRRREVGSLIQCLSRWFRAEPTSLFTMILFVPFRD